MEISAPIRQSALEGMLRAEKRIEGAASRIAGASTPAGDSVDLSTEAAGLLESRRLFEANAAVMETAGEIEDHLLDLLG